MYKTTKSLIDLHEYLTSLYGTSFKIISSNITQDSLENIFSQARSFSNPKPSSLQFYYAFRNTIFLTHHRHYSENSPYEFANSDILLSLSEIAKQFQIPEFPTENQVNFEITTIESQTLRDIRQKICRQVNRTYVNNCEKCKDTYETMSTTMDIMKTLENVFRSLLPQLKKNDFDIRDSLASYSVDCLINESNLELEICDKHNLVKTFCGLFVDRRLQLHCNTLEFKRKSSFASRSQSK